MSRDVQRIQKGLAIKTENGTVEAWVINGTGAPPGTTGASANAPIGSKWLNATAGVAYRKTADNDLAADWLREVDEQIYTLLGGDVDFGDATMDDASSYAGTILTNTTLKANLEQLEDAIEAISGPAIDTTAVVAATPTTVNTCLVDDCNAVEYEVFAYETADPTKRVAFKVFMFHNGEASADATLVTDTSYGELDFPGEKIAGLSFEGAIAGATTTQTVGLEISATAALTVISRRTALPAA